MTTPLLSELREPPQIGKYYMVPTVRYVWDNRVSDWPVIGPLHTDTDIGFPAIHFHVDGRFLNKSLMPHAYKLGWQGVAQINHRPISETHWTIMKHGQLQRKPILKRRQCSNLDYRWNVPHALTAAWGFAEKYGPEPKAIARKDGRLLCPHRKVDLSQFPPDDDGFVICPVHGLKVKCA